MCIHECNMCAEILIYEMDEIIYIYTYKYMYVFMYHSIHCSNKHAKDESTLSIPVYSFSLKERADEEKQEKH